MNNQTSTVIALFAYYQISDDKINLSEIPFVSNQAGWIVRAAVLNPADGL